MVKVGCSEMVFVDRFTHTIFEVSWQNAHSIQSRRLYHLWGQCAFLINKIMHIYANTLNVNNFTHFKIHLKVIKCYKFFKM